MTEKESMQLIASMINKAKNRFTETGFYIFFGVGLFLFVVLFSLLLHFLNYEKVLLCMVFNLVIIDLPVILYF